MLLNELTNLFSIYILVFKFLTSMHITVINLVLMNSKFDTYNIVN